MDLQTQIANGALDLIGAGENDVSRLTSLTHDTSRTAVWFRDNKDQARREALLDHDWDEAIAHLLGTDAGGDVAAINHEPYAYAYLIPTTIGSGSSAIAVLALRDLVDANDYQTSLERRLAGRYIHTDYTTDEFAWKLLLDIEIGFSAGLIKCIEYKLAIRGSSRFLAGDKGDKKRRVLMEEYQEIVLPAAKGQNQAQQWDEYNAGRPEIISEIT